MLPIPWTMTMSGRGGENERIEDSHGAPSGRVEGPSPDFRKNALPERVIPERRSPGLGPHYPPGRVDAKPDQQLAPDRGVPAECGGIERLQFGKVLAHSLPYHVPDPGRGRAPVSEWRTGMPPGFPIFLDTGASDTFTRPASSFLSHCSARDGLAAAGGNGAGCREGDATGSRVTGDGGGGSSSGSVDIGASEISTITTGGTATCGKRAETVDPRRITPA